MLGSQICLLHSQGAIMLLTVLPNYMYVYTIYTYVYICYTYTYICPYICEGKRFFKHNFEEGCH